MAGEYPNIAGYGINKLLLRKDERIDLALAALLIAREEYPKLQVDRYLHMLDEMGKAIHKVAKAKHSDYDVIGLVNQFLFELMRFRGNVENYYDPKNSYLNEVLERKVGIPITLSIIYMELCRRIGFSVEGVGMPGHFLLRKEVGDRVVFIDPFSKGELLTESDCRRRFDSIYQGKFSFDGSFLKPVDKKHILLRMLANLKAIYLATEQFSKALSLVDKMILIDPQNPDYIRDKGQIHYKMGQFSPALENLQTYLRLHPFAEDRQTVTEQVVALQTLVRTVN